MDKNTRRFALRAQTANAHAALDASIGAFDGLAGYRSYLRAISAFRMPLERQIGRLDWPQALADWRPLAVSGAIARDLEDLEVEPGEAAAPDLPLEGDRLFGALYVLEGSALGAQLLFRQAKELGLGETFGARHLALLSGGVASWRAFLERLEIADPFDLGSAVDGSCAAFERARLAFGAALHG